MELLKTKDYSIFKFILSNREVDVNHVKRLAKSIQRNNLLYIRPLICNEEMMLIDGQHRLEAAKSIGAEVYYMKIKGLTKADIAVLNSAQKNWTRADFVNFYALEGNEHYKMLAAWMDKYYWLPASCIIQVAANCKSEAIRNGEVKIKDPKKAETVFQWLRQLEPDFPFIKEARFVQAFVDTVKSQKLFEHLKRSINVKNFKSGNSYQDYHKSILSHLN